MIQLRIILACVAAGASFAAGWYVNGLRHESLADQAIAARAAAFLEAASAARTEEARRYDALHTIATQAQAQLDRAQADRRRADAAARSLRDAASIAAASCDSQAAAPSQSASAPGMVLANVLGRADAVAGELAAAFDASHAAGTACERGYGVIESSANKETQ